MNEHPTVIGLRVNQHPDVVKYALAEAGRRKSGLRAVHVTPDLATAAPLFEGLRDLARYLAADVPVTTVVLGGDVVEALAAEACRARVVVLGADELPWIARASGLEIAQAVAMISTAPVVVVPRTDLAARQTRAVVAVVDIAQEIDPQLHFAFDEAVRRGERLEVVYAAGMLCDYKERQAHLTHLEGRVSHLQRHHPAARARCVVEGGDRVRACLDWGLHASILVVGQPARSHLRSDTRSFASRILREASAPVAVVPLTRAPTSAQVVNTLLTETRT